MPKGDRLKLKTDHSSYRYYTWRGEVIGRSCVMCEQNHYTNGSIKLNAHHIWTMADYPELRYDPDNGITLCQSCHKLIHKAMKTNLINEYDILAMKQRHQQKTAVIFHNQLERLKAEW